jgi:hypothetical protein
MSGYDYNDREMRNWINLRCRVNWNMKQQQHEHAVKIANVQKYKLEAVCFVDSQNKTLFGGISFEVRQKRVAEITNNHGNLADIAHVACIFTTANDEHLHG